jgi:methionine-gamma-lyase
MTLAAPVSAPGSGWAPQTRNMATLSSHAGGGDAATGSVMPPIFQTSTFAFASTEDGARRFAGHGGHDDYVYTRMGNPTVRALEDAVAGLEGGHGGLATASGMAAIVATFMALLGKDRHLVGTDSVYGPTRVVVERDLQRFGVASSFVDTTDLELVRRAMRPETALVFVETPANPTLKITDIAACAAIAHAQGALLVVDNTFMSPYLQSPLELGADVVVHSMTKFLNGHSDVVAGIIVSAEAGLHERLFRTLILHGGTIDPHQAYLVLRGLKTLPLRMDKAQANAEHIARFLAAHPKVRWIAYPGLEDHPQHALARRQMRGPGALISFEVADGSIAASRRLLDHVEVPALAVSLGGVESLIQHPASMTHATVPHEERLAAGITDGLIRLAVGCENAEDLERDLARALDQV